MEYGDFNLFLDRMSQLSHREIMLQALDECAKAKFHRTSTASGQSYAARIKNFLHFMQHNERPGGATAEDFYRYKVVVAALVNRGEFNEAALEVFGVAP